MYRQAIRWHTLAASRGVAASHYHLGLMKAYGRGFSQDFSGAVIHFQQVASCWGCQQQVALTNIAAGITVGAMLYLCALQAAAAQHAPAMLYLGKMCLHGHGFPPDYDMALMWFEKAVAVDDLAVRAEATSARDELTSALKAASKANAEAVAGFDYGTPRVELE
eukprot:12221-Heterococcus_DN1.PRE.1